MFDLLISIHTYRPRLGAAALLIATGIAAFLPCTVSFADSPSDGEVGTARSKENAVSSRDLSAGPVTFEGTQAGDVRNDNELQLKLVWCPPGLFTMGSLPGETVYRQNEARVMARFSRGYWIGKYEVTQNEWEAIMESNPSEFSPIGFGKYKVIGKDTARFPVESMLVEEAEQFCRKLTECEHAARRLPAGCAYTLPNEAQWEYACRAGTTTATAFGDQLSSVSANFKGFLPYNGAKRGPFLFRPTDVGSYEPNAWGLHDMHGNVWEFCAGWYSDEAPGGIDPQPATSGTYRIGKGGSWFHEGRYTRSAFRYWIEPTMRQGTVGFRVALTKVE